jgi:DNA polymerase-3 subunit beta
MVMPAEALAATGTSTMEITVSKFELLRELTATQGVVERKTTIPILSNYLFEAGGDRLSLTANVMRCQGQKGRFLYHSGAQTT